MNDPVFVRSGRTYASYTDFWRLVELSGFKTVEATKADLQKDETYIWAAFDQEFMELLGEAPPGKRRAKVVFWYLERPDANLRPGMDPEETFRKAVTEILGWADSIWVSDRQFQVMDKRTVFSVLGSHPGLCEQEKGPSKYDIVHMSQATPRRALLLEELRKRSLVIGANAWGDERARTLSSAQLMLVIDRVDGLKVASALRWALAAAYRLPIVSESVQDPYPLVRNISIMTAPYGELARLVMDILPRSELLDEIADAAWRTLCEEWTFRKGVMDALSRTDFQ
jgi:hypothetical protein